MKESARYVKIVEWSEEDQCYVGSSPGLIYGGCHGDNEREVTIQCNPQKIIKAKFHVQALTYQK